MIEVSLHSIFKEGDLLVYAEKSERGNPAYVAGMSGVALARAVITKANGRKELPKPTRAEDYSPEYWADWALAEYQWYTGRRFKDVFERSSLPRLSACILCIMK